MKLPTPNRAVFALLAVAAGSFASAPSDSLDPVFAGLPFEQWLAGGEQARLHWAASVSRPHLSVHQRLRSEVEIRLDGAELAKRRGEGQLLVLLQITDPQGRRYQNHLSLDLAKTEKGIAKQDMVLTFSAFFTPGNYKIAVALYDTATREHALKLTNLDVLPLKADPLPDVWRDLPAVEYLPAADPPDSWYLPSLTAPVRLPLKPRYPLDIELVVNLTPSESGSHAAEAQSRNLSVLIPALKVIAALNGLNVELLDLARQRVVFRQDDVRLLDWVAMRRALAPAKAATIDLQSLERHRQSAAFFVAEVARIVAAPVKTQRILLVLSAPLAFEQKVDLEPISLAASPACRVFYIRYHSFQPPPTRPAVTRSSRRGPFGRWGQLPDPDIAALQFDQLESTLKPLAPRLFDVDTPEEFRKALAALLAEIANL